MKSLRTRIAAVTIVLVGSACITLLSAEVICQLFPQILPGAHAWKAGRVYAWNKTLVLEWLHRNDPTRNVAKFDFHPRYGWIGRPNMVKTEWENDGRYTFVTNREGFRDRNHALLPDRDRTRIAVVGDSFIWGLPLDQTDLLPQVLEQRLNSRGWPAEVLNFGVTGYANDQELLLIEDVVLGYKPDVVVLSFFYSNDLRDNVGPISTDSLNKPYFKLDQNGRLLLQNVPVPPPHYRTAVPVSLLDHAHIVLMERTFLYPLLEGIPRRLVRKAFQLTGQDRALEVYVDPGQNQKALAAALLRQMRMEVERSGARFVVLLLPGYGFFDGLHEEYEGIRTWFREDLRDVEIIEVGPAFEANQGQQLYGPMIEHWTPAGSRLAAEALSEQLLERYRPLAGAQRSTQG